MVVTENTIIGILGICLVILGLLIAFFVRGGAAAEVIRQGHDALIARVIILETQFAILWKAFEQSLVNALHHPDVASKLPDRLLEEYYAGTITAEGLNKLALIMKDVSVNPMVPVEERQSAKALILLLSEHAKWSPGSGMLEKTK